MEEGHTLPGVRIEWDKRGVDKMAMSVIWTGMVAASVLYGFWAGNGPAVAAACMEGAAAGRGGGPVLCRLYPDCKRDKETMDDISANVSANLLGLGNAATPLGIRAARRMAAKKPGVASDSLCMLVVCNTASIQLIPTTVAAVRLSAGCQTPFDILPAVWLTSAVALCVGVLAAKFMSRMGRRKK